MSTPNRQTIIAAAIYGTALPEKTGQRKLLWSELSTTEQAGYVAAAGALSHFAFGCKLTTLNLDSTKEFLTKSVNLEDLRLDADNALDAFLNVGACLVQE